LENASISLLRLQSLHAASSNQNQSKAGSTSINRISRQVRQLKKIRTPVLLLLPFSLCCACAVASLITSPLSPATVRFNLRFPVRPVDGLEHHWPPSKQSWGFMLIDKPKIVEPNQSWLRNEFGSVD
jgi:hypothetical protein